MPTTTNNGWTTPADTALVKDGASAIRTLGDNIDSTLGVYVASTPALAKISSTTFTTSSSQSFNNVFSATYLNYVVVFDIISTNDTDIKFRWRVSAADNTTSNYSWTQAGTFAATGTFGGGATNNDSSARFTGSNAVNSQKFGSYTFFNPFATATSGFTGSAIFSSGTANYNGSVIGMGFNGTTSFDGFTLFPAAGTMTGTVKIYGVAN